MLRYRLASVHALTTDLQNLPVSIRHFYLETQDSWHVAQLGHLDNESAGACRQELPFFRIACIQRSAQHRDKKENISWRQVCTALTRGKRPHERLLERCDKNA
jgi:hypothetical protein